MHGETHPFLSHDLIWSGNFFRGGLRHQASVTKLNGKRCLIIEMRTTTFTYFAAFHALPSTLLNDRSENKTVHKKKELTWISVNGFISKTQRTNWHERNFIVFCFCNVHHQNWWGLGGALKCSSTITIPKHPITKRQMMSTGCILTSQTQGI